MAKNKIIQATDLSKKDKRIEYAKLKHKCINCKRVGGTKFQTLFITETGENIYREYRAYCMVSSDPCELKIKLQVGITEELPELLKTEKNEIKNYKKSIIENKNKLLFGCTTTEKVLESFDTLKELIDVSTYLHHEYLKDYNNIVENNEKIDELNMLKKTVYTQVDKIKGYITKFNETENTLYAKEAAEIYVRELKPTLERIRSMEYDETRVWYNEDESTFHLQQNRYNITNLSLYTSRPSKVIEFQVGYDTSKKGKLLRSQNSTTEDSDMRFDSELGSGFIPEDQPNYGEGIDGITWNIPEYKDLWRRLPKKLKKALILNHDWLTDFMYKCVNSTNKNEPCSFIRPPNLIIPPEKDEEGLYNFDNKLYNYIFNNLNESIQQTYFSLIKTVNGNKDYEPFIFAIDNLVKKEIDFERGYF